MKLSVIKLSIRSLFVLICLPMLVVSQTQYRVFDIGSTIPDSVSSKGVSINSFGNVVLSYDMEHQSNVPAVWQNGVLTDLPIDGNRYPTGLDRWGNVVGTFTGNSWGWVFRTGAYAAVPDTSWLNPNFFYATSRAMAVNDNGVFTGAISQLAPAGSLPPYLPAVEAYRASLTATGAVQVERLGKYNDLSTTGAGINDLGHVVGAAGTSTNSTPVLFRNGQIEALPTNGGQLNRAEGVNNVGFAVGFAAVQTPTPGYSGGSGAVWDVRVPGSPQLTLVGQVQGSNQSWLYDINDAGVAVGRANLFNVSVLLWSKPIRWTAATGAQDLNTLLDASSSGWQITEVRSINDAGQIVGTARFNGSLPRVVRLDPQPVGNIRKGKYTSR